MTGHEAIRSRGTVGGDLLAGERPSAELFDEAAPPTVVNAIEDALSPFGVRIYEQHLPPARILELVAEADPDR